MEREEIARLYERYSQDVYRLALSYLGSCHDAEDICQSVFLQLLHKPTLLQPGKEKTWLLTCTANACKNQLKSFWRRNTQPLEDDRPVFIHDAHWELWEAVQRLKPGYRACIHLYYYEGYSQEQIASILKLSRTAVQTRMQRARALLKKELEDYA